MSEPDDSAEDAIGGTTAAEDDAHLAECLAILKQKYDAGDKAAVLMAVYQCALMRKPLPGWLRDAFIAAFESASGFKIKSWDQIFGRPHPKRARYKQRMEHRDLRYPVARLVHEFEKAGDPIGRPMFERIARKLKQTGALNEVGLTNIGGGTVDDIFYKHGGKEIYESIKPFFPDPEQ